MMVDYNMDDKLSDELYSWKLVHKITQGSIYWAEITSVCTELRWKILTREHPLIQ